MPPASAGVTSTRLRRAPVSSVLLGVLTDRPDAVIATAIDRRALAEAMSDRFCGDGPACDAVRSTLEDEHSTTVTLVPRSEWAFGGLDLDASALGLPPAEQARLGRLSHVVSIQVTTETSPRHRALRAAFAAAAFVAEKLDGIVHDPLLARLETSREFATHAVTSPLGASTFRRDRIEILYEPKEDGVVRLLTAGLARWGAPDVEAARVPWVAKAAVADLVLAVAAVVADGLTSGPCVISPGDVARARGDDVALAGEPVDAGPSPSLSPVAVDLVSVRGEAGDPNDFVARIEPPGGESPLAYLDLVEHILGPIADMAPQERDPQRQGNAQRRLGSVLARWAAAHAAGGRLLVRVPFPIPGDGGVESMWIEVTRYDALSVSGTLLDEPLGATDVSRGDAVTRPRAAVEDLKAIGFGDASGPEAQ